VKVFVKLKTKSTTTNSD